MNSKAKGEKIETIGAVIGAIFIFALIEVPYCALAEE